MFLYISKQCVLKSIKKGDDFMTEIQFNVNQMNDLHISKNKVDAKARKVASKDSSVFQKDNAITEQEAKVLRKEFGIGKKEFAELHNAGADEFLDALLHAADGETDPAKIMEARKKVVKQFIVNSRTETLSPKLVRQLEKFGFSQKDLNDSVASNDMDKYAPRRTITPKAESGKPQITMRMEFAKNNNDEITNIRLFDKNATFDDINDPDRVLIRLSPDHPNVFVEYSDDNSPIGFYKLNGDGGLAEIDDPRKLEKKEEVPKDEGLGSAEEAPEEEPIAPPAPKFSEVFAKNKKVNINEKGSRQRLTAKEEWTTNLSVPKSAGYTEDGLPTKISIALPSDYGSVGPDGKKQVRYQTLKLVDPENMIYSDGAGVRKFKMEITEDGINLSLVDTEDSKIKEFLDKNTEIVAEEAKEKALNEEQNKLAIKSKEDSDSIMSRLADRNSSWETYLQAGSDNGHLTGAHGLLEKLVDESDITGIKTYNDLKPAIDGLLARIPEDLRTTPEYKKIEEAISKLASKPNEDIKSAWYNQMFRVGNTPIRDLDLALENYAKVHMAKRVQGTNHANNSFLVGGSGDHKVVIQPDRKDSMWKSDAKFTIGGKDYYLYQSRMLMDRTVDFQDVVEHKDDGTLNELSLIRNKATGNNRQGEIEFNAERAAAEKFYFQTKGGKELPVVVEGGVAYVQSSDGSTKVPVNDILNGRADMPE